MKHLAFRRATLVLLSLNACGRSEAEYSKVVVERDAALRERDSLVKLADELRNGASRRIAEIRDAYQKSDFDAVQLGTTAIVQFHPGTPEAKEAVSLAARATKAQMEVQARAEREATRGKEEQLRGTIRVASVVTDDPNSAGGVDLSIRWQNRSAKTVKYAHFSVVAYNSVGDPVECTIRGYSEFTGQVTGPIRPGSWSGEGRSWENAWYNNSIVRGKLTEIRIEYTDGTTAAISGDDVKYVRY
jgi:hypothetical protein